MWVIRDANSDGDGVDYFTVDSSGNHITGWIWGYKEERYVFENIVLAKMALAVLRTQGYDCKLLRVKK